MANLNLWNTKAIQQFPQDADEDGCDTILDYVNRAESTLEIVEGGGSMYDDEMTPREKRKFITELKNYIKKFKPHAEAEAVMIIEEMKEESPAVQEEESAPTANQLLIAKELELAQRELALQTRLEELEAREAELKVRETQLDKKEQDIEKANAFFKAKRAELKEREAQLKERETKLATEQSELVRELQLGTEELAKEKAQLVAGIANRKTQVSKELFEQAHDLYVNNPNTQVEELAKQMGVSRRTFYRYLKRAEEVALRQGR